MRSRLSAPVAWGILSAALISADSRTLAGQTSSSQHPTLEQLFTVKGLSDVQMSPDRQALLYTVSTTDLEKNENDSDIWMLRRVGGEWSEPIQMTSNPKSDTRPRWRPDGKAFAFLSARGGNGDAGESGSGAQLYSMNINGGEAREVFSHQTSIAAFEWSPDGRSLAFRAADEETEADKADKEKGRDIEVEDDAEGFSHLWVLDVATGDAHRATEGDGFTVGAFSWSPDGSTIAFSATPTGRPMDSWRSDVYTVAAHDSAPASNKLTTNPGPDANPVWSPDGRSIIYSGQATDRYQVAQNHVFRIPATGGRPEDISPAADIQPQTYTLTPDGLGAFFQATVGTTRALFYMSLDEREPIRLTPESGVYASVGFSDDRRSVGFVYESPERPAELYVGSLATRPSRSAIAAESPLTEHNTHAMEWAVGETEVLRWKGADGRDVEGIVVYPMDWTADLGPRALVVKIHGGPSGVYVQNFQAASASADAQRYAADGYVVLLPNPRGSSGYGESGLQAVVGDWGGLDFQDIMTGVDTLIARGVAHPDSLGVMGWSYGGYMTAWTVTQTSRFKAAIPGAAITENIAMWGTQDIQHVFEAYFGGGPYEPGMWEVYQRSNPLAHVSRATTPTLILHGANDPRVPPNQARIFYRALKANGVPTELVWLPRTGHGPREPGLRYETARRQKEWMDRWIRQHTPRPVSEDGDRP